MSENRNVKFIDRGVFVIFDKVADTWIGQPIIEKHPAAAARLFSQLLADKNTTLSSHPKDYNLMHVGYILDDGTIRGEGPSVVVTGEAWLSMATQSAEVINA